jgi:putative lipase involved disintegration of autophagic bodies
MRESIVIVVQTILQQMNGLRILVTSHSMGGAMASYAFDLLVHISLSLSLFVK